MKLENLIHDIKDVVQKYENVNYDDTVPEFPSKLDKRVRVSKYLHPCLRTDLEEALAECHSNDLMVYVFESYRSPARQLSLYNQGRTSKGRIVTNAQPFESWHNYGLAFDLVFDGDERDGIQWSWEGDYNNDKVEGEKRSDYERVGEILLKYDFEWGANWKRFKEMPHFQKTFNLPIKEAKKLYNQNANLQTVWNEITRRDSSK